MGAVLLVPQPPIWYGPRSTVPSSEGIRDDPTGPSTSSSPITGEEGARPPVCKHQDPFGHDHWMTVEDLCEAKIEQAKTDIQRRIYNQDSPSCRRVPKYIRPLDLPELAGDDPLDDEPEPALFKYCRTRLGRRFLLLPFFTITICEFGNTISITICSYYFSITNLW